LSIMTRSIDPILVSLAPYTAVPSTLSLPIREPVSLVSVTIVEPPLLKNVQQAAQRIVPSVENSVTGAAAQAAGAAVTPTEPKPQLEPIAPGPKPAQPANAAAGTP
jgi:hypothetical protein